MQLRDRGPATWRELVGFCDRHQKSKPRNRAREIFVVARGETTRALRLCRELDSPSRRKYAQNGDKVDHALRAKTTTLSMSQTLAGVPGLEPRLSGDYVFDNSVQFSKLASREA